MTRSLKCAVIGAGAAGSAAAYHLARSGARVCVFEQYPLLHDRGSSHGSTRLFRVAYFEDPHYVPLLRRCIEMWRDLELTSGERLFFQIGALQVGHGDGVLIPGVLRTAKEYDLPIEKLTEHRAKERFPWFNLDKNTSAIVDCEAGFILAESAVRTHLEAARSLGAQICAEERVVNWCDSGKTLSLETDKDKYQFDRIIFTPGAWANRYLAELGINIQPVRKTVHWIAQGDERFRVGAGFIPFVIETKDSEILYGFPATDDAGVKIALHTGGENSDTPDNVNRIASIRDDEPVINALNTYAPGLPSIIQRRKTCLYEMSPDGHFIIDKHPDDNRVVFALGLSGHGFKFTPLIGAVMADLALKGGTLSPIGFLNLNRFNASGDIKALL